MHKNVLSRFFMDGLTTETNTAPVLDDEDSLVCYCFRQTTRSLKACHKRCGSLKGVEAETRAGTACGGCKIILQSLFSEEPSSAAEAYINPIVGTTCSKPGTKVMKSFIIHDKNVYSRIYSSNAVAPQLGNCDSSTDLEYAVLDHAGNPILHRRSSMKTNETFTFDTRDVNLPKPFYGMFLLQISRQNFGAARFNTYWCNEKGETTTHELGGTGRPKIFVPLLIDRGFLDGPNTVYLALQNPYQKPIRFRISGFDVDTLEELNWDAELAPYTSSWVNANEYLYRPALDKFKGKRVAVRIATHSMDAFSAITVYFFAHNKNTDLWTANHL